MAKKKAAAPEPAGESAPMWIVSYADLVTLTMSFFVVLYALKQGGEKQQMEVAAAIKTQFDPSYIPPLDSQSIYDQYIRRAHGLPGPPFANMGGNSSKPIKGAEGSNPNVENIRPGNQVVTGGRITFPVGQTSLDETSLDTIRQIVTKVRGLNNILIIKGHTSADEIPLHPDDPYGLALSIARSMKVIDQLVELGIDRKVLRPEACGAYEPVKTGVYDESGLRQNRRVEIFTTDNTASQFTPAATVPATANHAVASSH